MHRKQSLGLPLPILTPSKTVLAYSKKKQSLGLPLPILTPSKTVLAYSKRKRSLGLPLPTLIPSKPVLAYSITWSISKQFFLITHPSDCLHSPGTWNTLRK
jgi:hypothetical protein